MAVKPVPNTRFNYLHFLGWTAALGAVLFFALLGGNWFAGVALKAYLFYAGVLGLLAVPLSWAAVRAFQARPIAMNSAPVPLMPIERLPFVLVWTRHSIMVAALLMAGWHGWAMVAACTIVFNFVGVHTIRGAQRGWNARLAEALGSGGR
jgi:hypothetical protein